MTNKYVAYYRVSTKKQGESGLGLEAQRTYVHHFFKSDSLIAEFTEVMSGKGVLNRPELKKALALCQAEKATLVVAKIDRLSRNTEDALAIYRELDGRLVSCDIPNLDKFTLTLFMAIADRERELIGIRTRMALTEKRKRDGEWRKGSEAFRDKRALDKSIEATKDKAAANENNRRAVMMIRSFRQQGYNWLTIAQELNRAGFRTSRSKLFQAVQVQRLWKTAP